MAMKLYVGNLSAVVDEAEAEAMAAADVIATLVGRRWIKVNGK
jgi:hypothetical protein